ncbi:MAG: hypothetical protein P4L84_15275 [Isosphaeraceae bacterium]|nr:hypothetical protein [Isosphaeraceae bacterium]
MPIPAPIKPRSVSSSTKAASIPMPIPVARHLAAPVSERSQNATSVPATDARLQRLPSADY